MISWNNHALLPKAYKRVEQNQIAGLYFFQALGAQDQIADINY